MAPPFKEAMIRIDFGTGINKEDELIEKAIELKIIEKAGSWFSYDGGKIRIQGLQPLTDRIKEDKVLYDEIMKKVKSGNAPEEEPAPKTAKGKAKVSLDDEDMVV